MSLKKYYILFTPWCQYQNLKCFKYFPRSCNFLVSYKRHARYLKFYFIFPFIHNMCTDSKQKIVFFAEYRAGSGCTYFTETNKTPFKKAIEWMIIVFSIFFMNKRMCNKAFCSHTIYVIELLYQRYIEQICDYIIKLSQRTMLTT